MIVSDEYLDEMWSRYDKAKAKNWDDFFNKHFNTRNDMTNLDNIEVKNAGFTAEVKGKEVKVSIEDKAKQSNVEVGTHVHPHAPAHKPA